MTPAPTGNNDSYDLQPHPALEAIYLHLTRACNLRCVYCYANAGEPNADELDMTSWQRVLAQAVALQPRKIVFTGGEPLLRQDLPALALFLRLHSLAQGIHLCLDTNGLLITPTLAAALGPLFDEVRLSLDGFPATHDELRGAGSHIAALRAIGYLRQAGVLPSVAVTASAANEAELPAFVDYLLREWGIHTVRINPLRPLGRAASRLDLAPHRGWPCSEAGQEARQPCAGPVSCLGTTLSITPQGQVYPCHWLAQPRDLLGNVQCEPLVSIYERLVQTIRPTPFVPNTCHPPSPDV